MNKRNILLGLCILMGLQSFAQDIKLPAPDKTRGCAVMEALANRKSVREYSDRMLSDKDLSDLLWAASGVNRPDGKLTSPTARNRQEIRLYAFTKDGVYLYQPESHSLKQNVKGDYRNLIAGGQSFAALAPVCLLMVADMDKYGNNGDHARLMVSVDTGIMSENINIFCSATGLCTVPRGTMDDKGLIKLLNLNENQFPLINNPVGYAK